MASSFKNAGATLGISDGPSSVIYTAGSSSTAVIHAIYISNHSSTNTMKVNVRVTTDGGSTYYYVGKSLFVDVENTLVLDKPINLENNDKISIFCDPHVDSSTPTAECFLSILEIT